MKERKFDGNADRDRAHPNGAARLVSSRPPAGDELPARWACPISRRAHHARGWRRPGASAAGEPPGLVAGERPVGSTAPVRLVTSKVVHRPYPHKLVDRERFDRALADAKAVGADERAPAHGGRSGGGDGDLGDLLVGRRPSGGAAARDRHPPGRGKGADREIVGEIQERKATLDEIRGKAAVRGELGAGRRAGASLDGTAVPKLPKRRRWRVDSGLDPDPRKAVGFAALERGPGSPRWL